MKSVSSVIVGLWLATASAAAITLVSVDQEVAIGKQVDAEMRAKLPELRDAETVAYIRDIGRRLVAVAPGPKYPYRFSIANYREINAFALPGGPVWIHRGVIQSATTESQLASVLAHEIAHVAQRHAADQLTNATLTNWGLGLLGAVLGNSGGASTAQMAAGLFANGVFLKFSRDDEQEADRVGLQLLTRAGWEGRGMVELFEVLRAEAKRDPGKVEVLLSSHPSPQDRIRALQGDALSRSAGRRTTQQFRAIRARLSRMPAAAAMPRD